jgi:tRNA-dihydrouridine synthase B
LARKHLAWYSAGLPGSAAFRATVMRMPDCREVERLIDAFYGPLIEAGVEPVGETMPGIDTGENLDALAA